jgi:class 3 adenylate cyclase
LCVSYLVICSVYLRLTAPGQWTTLVCASAPLFTSLCVVFMSLLWNPGTNIYGALAVAPMVTYALLTRKPIHTLLGGLLMMAAYPLVNLLHHPIPDNATIQFISNILLMNCVCILVLLEAVKMHQLRWRSFCHQQEVATERDKISAMAASLETKVLERTALLKKSNETFSRFVPTEFLHVLGYDDISQVKLGEARQSEMTVVFADLHNFTLMSEVLGPQETMALLNRILSRLGPCVRKHGGFIDKYIGDATVALFPGSPQQALIAAQDMCMALQESDYLGSLRGKVVIGIGIHQGTLMMGTLGEAERFEAAAIGDAVNVAARVKSLTSVFGAQLLITSSVYAALSTTEKENCRWLGLVTLKGRSQAVDVYECFANDNLDRVTVLRETRSAFESALRSYLQGEVAQAGAVLEAIAEDCPWDKPLQFWVKRCSSDLQLRNIPNGSLKHF